MRYVQRIDDSKMWKEQFEDSIKGRAKMQGDYYVLEQAGRGENTQILPQVAEDIVKAKTKMRTYKRKNNSNNNHKPFKRTRRRKGATKKRTVKRKTRRGRITKKRKATRRR